MKKIGISIGTLQRRYGEARALEIASECGFDAVDMDLEHYGTQRDNVYKSFDAMQEHFTKIGERARELGVIISQTHGRCLTYSPDAERCEFTRWVSERDLFATSLLGAPACVIHNINSSYWGDRDGDFIHAKNAEMMGDLIPFAEKYGVSIGFETFGGAIKGEGKRGVQFFGDSVEFLKQYNMNKTENKVICLDTGHTNEAVYTATLDGRTVPGIVESIRMFGKELKLLHLHDNNSFTDQHLPPGWVGRLGSIDWDGVMEALDDIGYDGIYNFELSLAIFRPILDEMMPLLHKYLRDFMSRYQ